MTKKLTEAFDFDDIEQDEINLENTISGIRILGKIKDSIKNENSYIVRHQISNTFDEFVEFVEKDLPYIVANKESLLDMLASKSQTLNLCASIKDRSIKEYGIGTVGFKETIDKLFSTLKKAFSLLGFSKWQNIGQKIKIKVVWNEMRIPYTGEDYTSANVLRCGVVYSLYEMLLKNIEYVVNTFSFDLKSIIDGGTHQTYIGHFNVFSQYANPAKDNIKKKLKDYYKNAFEDAFTPKDDPYTRITGREFNHILKVGKDFVNLKKSPILFEAFDFTEDTPIEDIESQIEHNKTLALYKSSSMHDAVVEEFKKLKRNQGGYGLPLNVAISEDSLWMVDYIVQDALDIFAEGDIRKFCEERGMYIFFRYCENNVRPFYFSPKVDKFVIDFDNAGMIHNYLESLVNNIKKYEAKWIYDYERYAKFITNLEIKGYNFSNLANLGYYIGFLLDGTLQLTVNGKKFYNFVAFSYIRDEETIEECLDRALWYQQILAEKFTKEELLKFTNDFIRGNKDRKDLSSGLNETFDFDHSSFTDVGKLAMDSLDQSIIWTNLFFNLKEKDHELEIVPFLKWIFKEVYAIHFWLDQIENYVGMSFLNWKCPEWPYLIYDLEIPLKDVDPNSKESVLKFFRHIYSYLMEYYTTHSEDYDFPYPFNKEKTSAKLNSLFDREPINEAFDFENDKEDFDIDVRKVRTSLLVKELSELYNKLKQISPSPLWFLETKHGVVADILVKYGQNHEIISIPMARMKIGGKNVIISSEGTFKIGKAIRYGEMTPISEMPDNIYNQVISKMENYIKDAKDF